MIIELEVFTVLVIILVLNTIIDHLFNWIFRVVIEEDESLFVASLVVYIIKIILLFLLISKLLN